MRTITLAIGLLVGLICAAFAQEAQDRDGFDGRGREESGGQRSDDVLLSQQNDPDRFNVRNYGARGDGLTDDSAAIASAAGAAATSSAAGQPATLYFPAGTYRLVKPLPMWTVMVSILGDGPGRSVVLVDGALSGDVFSWSGVWAGPNYNGTDTISPLTTQRAGVEVKGIRIAGTRATTHLQNALVFYDGADQVFMHDVEVLDLTGRALYSGALRGTMRESHFKRLRFARCGSPGAPVVDFNSGGSFVGSNELSIDALDILAPYGTGMAIHNSSVLRSANIKFSGLRIVGLENGGAPADLLQVGDESLAGNVKNIDFEQTELINPPSGFAAIRFAAPNFAVAPYAIRFQGKISGEAANGKGIAIDAGRSLFFDLMDLQTRDVNVTVGSSKTVGGPIVFDGHGQEAGWTRAIDPSSIRNVFRPVSNTLQQF
jgi:hypothetical protein